MSEVARLEKICLEYEETIRKKDEEIMELETKIEQMKNITVEVPKPESGLVA